MVVETGGGGGWGAKGNENLSVHRVLLQLRTISLLNGTLCAGQGCNHNILC